MYNMYNMYNIHTSIPTSISLPTTQSTTQSINLPN